MNFSRSIDHGFRPSVLTNSKTRATERSKGSLSDLCSASSRCANSIIRSAYSWVSASVSPPSARNWSMTSCLRNHLSKLCCCITSPPLTTQVNISSLAFFLYITSNNSLVTSSFQLVIIRCKNHFLVDVLLFINVFT